ncbi:hypothetical protein CI102_6267 [Trichoderma harzianum]|uniref:Steroid 5-alpha reductase C-terminal domain-containing protein n=1 Tax=Trichoderma harzianum CBS 226.95 TaxID=983964 RepID=A0A2T4AR97_TRIHA|nr:hypothetical protein M431DRAFT_491191 [Trichoderma harzianum CBS 226.95]PKK48567.1 hypothetical protein CI102_6267 [Trichoderma harzianum]PTB59584.1 hypothetical protein M431DRAFT_491191 [Trichoderma harzianum CBS 226.95]
MALPQVKSLQDCVDYSKVVEPFLPQLYQLPHHIWESIDSLDALRELYVTTNPLISGFAASLVVGLLALIVSEINRNYSQIDRLWSILPNLYVVHIALWARVAGLPHGRVDLIALCTTLWSIRLTYNYWRRGGYNIGSEDYRWMIVKAQLNSVVWFIFNVTFISFIQSILLYLFSCVPAYVILLSSQFEPEVQAVDMVFAGVEILLVLSEWISDGQQWAYQTAKYKYKDTGKLTSGYTSAELDRGFITTGLWAYSRHPNFFAEQTIWFMLYQWSCFATNTPYSWAGIGAVLLVLLFQGSTNLTENITSGKYPEYKAYQNHVGMFIPKTLIPYATPGPKVIRSSELIKRAEQKQKHKKKQG